MRLLEQLRKSARAQSFYSIASRRDRFIWLPFFEVNKENSEYALHTLVSIHGQT